MKELKPVKKTYYLVDGVSKTDNKKDVQRFFEEVKKYGYFINDVQVSMTLKIDNPFFENYEIHLSYKKTKNLTNYGYNDNLRLGQSIIIENDLEKEETNIMTDWNIYTLPSGEKYYKIDDQCFKI